MRRVVGDRRRRHLHGPAALRDGAGRRAACRLAKIPTTAANQADGVLAAIARDRRRARPTSISSSTAPPPPPTPCSSARSARSGSITTRGLPRHAGARPAHAAQALRHDRHVRAADPARAAPRGRRAHERARRGGDAARRGGGRARPRARCSTPAARRSSSTSCTPTPTRRTSCAPGEIVRALWPNDYVTLGHALLSEYREYERGTTASVNAAVQPILDRYVRRLQGELAAQGFTRDLLVMNGNGGTVSARAGRARGGQDRDVGAGLGRDGGGGDAGAVGPRQRHHLRHGRHLHRRGADPRRRAGGLRRARRIDYGLPIHVPMVDVRTRRRRRRLDRLDRRRRHAAGRAGSRPAPSPARSATAAAARGRPSPTPTCVLGRLDPERLLAVARPRRRSSDVRAHLRATAGAAARPERRGRRPRP